MSERKVCSEEFKRKAVRLAKKRGNLTETARDLGISENALHGWKSRFEKTPEHPFPGNGTPREPSSRNSNAECSPQGGKRRPKIDMLLQAL